jgi:hypothetical protein
VNINRKTTAGPPLAEAVPIIEKIPAPMIAAMPSEVKSTTPSVRVSPVDECVASDNPSAASR